MDKVLRKAIDLAGGVSKVAKHFRISSQAVSQWQKCPSIRLHGLAELSGVSMHELRQDIFGPALRPSPLSPLPMGDGKQKEAA